MKKQLTRTLAPLSRALALSALLAASAAHESASAQTARAIFVRVPFEFVVGEERLPAGDYTISRVVRDSEKTLLIRGADGRAKAAVHTNAAGPRSSSPDAKLVFTRHGEQYFLTRVSTPGAASARALVKSRVQRSLEREQAESAKRAGGGGGAGESAGGETVTIVGGVR